MHVKRQILRLLQQALQAGLSIKEIHLDRLDPLPAKRCPAVLVREDERGESIKPLDLDGTQERTLFVNVASVVAQVDGYGEAADALALQVELLLAAEDGAAIPFVQELTALCAGGIALATSRPVLSGEGDVAVAVTLHTWQFTYFVHPSRPDVAVT